jgi:hypothetical protein
MIVGMMTIVIGFGGPKAIIIISLTPICPFQGVPVHLSSLISIGKTVSLSGPDENLQSAHSLPSSVASLIITNRGIPISSITDKTSAIHSLVSPSGDLCTAS